MNNSYIDHYRAARYVYRRYTITSANDTSIDASKVETIHNPLRGNIAFEKDVEALSISVCNMFESGQNVEESTSGYRIIRDLAYAVSLAEVSNHVTEYARSRIFNSFVKVEYAEIVENKRRKDRAGSFIWHYDDCPNMYLKVLIHLNSVKDHSFGAFQYMEKNNGRPLVMTSSRVGPGTRKNQALPGSRVSDELAEYWLANWAHSRFFVGERGSHLVFSPNIIHRASPAYSSCKRPRIALFLFIRPSLEEHSYHHSALPVNIIGSTDVKAYSLD